MIPLFFLPIERILKKFKKSFYERTYPRGVGTKQSTSQGRCIIDVITSTCQEKNTGKYAIKNRSHN